VTKTRIEIFRKIKIAKSTRRKRTRRDIPLLILRAIKKSIVHWKKTSIEKAPAARISIAMRKIVIDTTKTNVDIISKFFHTSSCCLLHLVVNNNVFNQIVAKHRDDKEKKEKDKEETKVKEETVMKTNHTINEGFNNLDIKSEIKEVSFVHNILCIMFKKLKNRILCNNTIVGTYVTNRSR